MTDVDRPPRPVRRPRQHRLGPGEQAPDGVVSVYVDGAAKYNPNGPAGWAWFVSRDCWRSDCKSVESSDRAELRSLALALEDAPSDVPVLLVSDSMYALRNVFELARGWKGRDWLRRDGLPPDNVDLLVQAEAALSSRTADTWYRHVRSHDKAGDPGHPDVAGNTAADGLAKKARDGARRSPRSAGPGWTLRKDDR